MFFRIIVEVGSGKTPGSAANDADGGKSSPSDPYWENQSAPQGQVLPLRIPENDDAVIIPSDAHWYTRGSTIAIAGLLAVVLIASACAAFSMWALGL